MERGRIKINYFESKPPTVKIRLINNTVLLTNYELADLFGCFVGKIDALIKSIFKSNLLNETDVTFIHRYTDKGIDKEIVFYNLDVLLFISYRIETLEAKVFRDFVKNALQKHLNNKEKPNNLPFFIFNPSLN